MTGTVPNGTKRRYSYQYDGLNRLLRGVYSQPGSSVSANDYFSEILSYDLNGNISTLKRFSAPSSGTTAEKIDDLIYNYTGNRLDKITLPVGVVNNPSGYNALQNNMEYDFNGNLKIHLDKGISGITYNYLNLPSLISITNGSQKVTSKVNYLYRADGTKIRKLSTNLVTSVTTDYLDGFQYLKSDTFFGCLDCPPPAAELQFVPTSEGYFDFVKNKYIYNYVDHLGNTRLSYFNNGSSVEVLEENNYYPFGLKHEGYNALAGNSAYQYKYQGQELQTETGWYSFKWRNYMPDLGRFFNVDPLAEKYPYNSTYAFQENKLGMGVELEGLELLKIHTGFFAIHGNAMKVKRAPASQRDSNGHPTFTAGDIGLTTSGYNPNGARITTGSTGLRLDSYKYDGPVPDAVQMQNTRDKISTKVRQSFKTTKTGAEMWNIKQYRADQASSASSGIKEIVKLVKLGMSIPDAIKSTNDYVQATKDINAITDQAVNMDKAISLVNSSGIEMNQQTKNDVINYIFDGTLPNPDAGLMPNSLIIQNGTEIMKTNGIPIQSLDEQLTTKSRKIPQ
ncbi:RHS repeat-associated core domain-containing protein [Chryseobacterium taeanense]|uniref:RHS repeat-associated core domain-containing protein n=1 Tax=Chryseobacterium taeanense TaxID=311334 RepID=A0A1G8P4T8_9FLAO|nr:RHS repeat-associated core domain-containing protein [Chryseobacterium taeanense]SDI87442.1 RHS repeat-associated core domain-containing protein [Chryseobacterium taeanense]